MTIASLLQQYTSGNTTCHQVVQKYLQVIQEKDPQIGAFLTLCETEAQEEAKKKDIEQDFSGKLAGVPVGIKDVICTKGIPTTAASKILENFVPQYDATVVERLKAAGAIVVGKNNCDEFANGSSNEYSAFKICKNPQDLTLVPGGSSGGSAAAVAAGECVFSIGTDTGGSIRQPANFCGVVGLKPSYGRVSRYGSLAYASSFDTIGPITNTVEDAARVLEVIAGKDPLDSTTVNAPVPKYSAALDQDIRGKKVGVIKQYMNAQGLDPQMKQIAENAIAILQKKGAQITEISLPLTEYAIPTYYLLAKAEGSTNYARYDGIRYGHASKDIEHTEDIYTKSRSEGFGDEIKRCIMMGTYTLSAGYYDAYYLKAAKVRTLITQDFAKTFEQVDVLVTPVSPFLPFQIGEKSNDPLQMYLADIYTVMPSLAGICGIAVPTEKIGHLKTGVQILGPQLGEEKILNFSWHLEQEFSSERV